MEKDIVERLEYEYAMENLQACKDGALEIKKLRRQLYFAVGMLSTYSEFGDNHPDEVLKLVERWSEVSEENVG